MENTSLDDSVLILFEKVQPTPEVVIVNEVINSSSELENVSEVSSSNIIRDADSSTVFRQPAVYLEVCDDSAPVLRGKKRSPSKIPRLSIGPSSEPNKEASKKKHQKIECGICFDGQEEIDESNRCLMSTVCGHIFCDSCLNVSMSNSTLCPKCRKRLGKKQFHPIYF